MNGFCLKQGLRFILIILFKVHMIPNWLIFIDVMFGSKGGVKNDLKC